MPTKIHLVKAIVFPVVMYEFESWTIKKAEYQRIDAFELWTLESPLDCKEIQPVHRKGDQSWVFIGRTDVEAETPIFWPLNEVLAHWKHWGSHQFWSQWRSRLSFSSVAQSCPTLCDLMNRSTPGLPVHHQLPEFTQTHVHWVSDAIQPSHPLSSPSPPALNLSQHEGLFQWVNSLYHMAKVLELQLQHQAFQWIFRVDFL